VKDGVLCAPDVASCLGGITHCIVVQRTRIATRGEIEKRETQDRIYCANEPFLTGTVVEANQRHQLDGVRSERAAAGRSLRRCNHSSSMS
jgi:hypothetical protein